MHRLRSTCFFLILLTSYSALADTEFEDSIPVETVEALFNAYYEDRFAIYSDIAEEFPDFPIPTGFSVVGSVYQMTTLRVVFKTDTDEDAALQSMIEVFEVQDWVQLPTFSRQRQEVGFISPPLINMGRAQNMCHDDLGYLTLRYSSGEGTNYLSTSISVIRSNRQGTCEQQIAMQQASYGQYSQPFGIGQYLPRLEIPESQNRPRAAFLSGGTSSSGNSVETDGSITTDQDIEEVYRFFADQIEAQGWELDSEVVGSLSANGTWTKSPESNLNLIGRLSVLNSGESDYELQFRLLAEGYTRDNSAIFSPIQR
ncbi:MAG: hypothetical protein JKY86_10220 [Gammaproteobacteria bacterium]|nr:hypothetical protein [Gammaproteobacteria bacterium]